MIITGGHPYQGYSTGILKLDERCYPMTSGDVGNATSYPFPVLIREVKGLLNNPSPPITTPDGAYTEYVQLCINEAIQLEKDGVRCIAMCCGFLSLIQQVTAAHVNIPVMASPLMMIPIVHQMIRPEQSIVVVTASARLLTNEFFTAVGADLNDRINLVGLDDSKSFNSMCMGGKTLSFEYNDLREDIINLIENAQKKNPNIGAILLECSSLPPFANDVREATGLPVFDFIACVKWMHNAVVPEKYSGYI